MSHLRAFPPLNGIVARRAVNVSGHDSLPDAAGADDRGDYSHSMVPGGFEVTSRTTRLTSSTSLVMRFEIRASRS